MQKCKRANSATPPGVSALGLGCMQMTYGDAPIGDKQEMIASSDTRSRQSPLHTGGAPGQVELTSTHFSDIAQAMSQITVVGNRS